MTVRELSGTTAVVTGASRGFGRATAIALAGRGAHVVGIARSEPNLEQLRQELGDRFEFEVADVADPSLPERLLAQYQPQIVVLNAGATPVAAPLSEQTWEPSAPTGRRTSARPSTLPGQPACPARSGFGGGHHLSAAALRGSPLSGGYAGAKSTVKYISSYATAEAESCSLGLRFVAILPMLTPATDLGAAGVAAYAERGRHHRRGISGPTRSDPDARAPRQDDCRRRVDDSYSGAAYLLTGTELSPVA